MQEWDIIKDGVLVNFQAIRDQAAYYRVERIAGLLLFAKLERCTVSAHAQCIIETRVKKNYP